MKFPMNYVGPIALRIKNGLSFEEVLHEICKKFMKYVGPITLNDKWAQIEIMIPLS